MKRIPNISRRHFLHTSAAIGMGFTGLHRFLRNPNVGPPLVGCGYGDLIPDPNGILDLPRGFSYSTFSMVGESMDDGLLVPGDHDGMAAFPWHNGKTILIRNHELSWDEKTKSPFGLENEHLSLIDQNLLYDAGGGTFPSLGGTTTLIYDTVARQLERHFLSLAGTIRNCAGGPTPWNTWISCEETTQEKIGLFDRDHGFNFEVPLYDQVGLTKAVPLTAMGRFKHEAIAVDPASGIVFQTEDVSDGLIYRYIPDTPGDLAAGGRLQALRIKDMEGADTRNWSEQIIPVGQAMAVDWVDLEDVLSPNNDLRKQGHSKGAAKFARGEGMWYGMGAVYFACTDGGKRNFGQIWKYKPSQFEGQPEEVEQCGMLELFIESEDNHLVEGADNITVAPWGDLIICEDGDDTQYIDIVSPSGDICKLARNSLSTSEFAGATFSPDGSTLFVNIQKPGVSLAITGPWLSTTAQHSIKSMGGPESALLKQNRPNPFSAETQIPYVLRKPTRVHLKIFDATGTCIKEFDFGNQPAGSYSVRWDAADPSGTRVPAGIYFVQMRTSLVTALKKLIVQ